MHDRCPFKSKFLTRSPGPWAVACVGGLQVSSMTIKVNLRPDSDGSWARKWILKSLASAPQKPWQWPHARPFFQHSPACLCPPRAHHRAHHRATCVWKQIHQETDGNWIPLIVSTKCQKIETADAGSVKGEKKLRCRPAGGPAALTGPEEYTTRVNYFSLVTRTMSWHFYKHHSYFCRDVYKCTT